MIIEVTLKNPAFCVQDEVYIIKDYTSELGGVLSEAEVECSVTFYSQEVKVDRCSVTLTSSQYAALSESVRQVTGLPLANLGS